MKKEYINSEICQKCANCCKIAWMHTKDKDLALRLSWLDTDKIVVKKLTKDIWKIIFNFPCQKLIKKKGKFYCTQYNKKRPGFCKEYPLNFKGASKEGIKDASKIWPLIKEIIRE